MNKLIKMTLITAILAVPISGIAQGVAWNGIVSVETVETTPGNQVSVDINLNNNDLDISGMEIPLKFSNSNIVFDSVSFVGSLKPPTISGVYFQTDLNSVKITYFPDAFVNPLPKISAVSGIIGRMFFTVLPSAQPGFFPIDSINKDSLIGTGTHLVTRINVSDNDGNTTYLPVFIPGGILVKVPTAIDDESSGALLPTVFALEQNYPNPFNPTTEIQFALPTTSHVSLEIFNILGQKTATLVDGSYPAGNHEVTLDATDYPSGIYFYRLLHDKGSLTKKMVLMK